MGDGEKGPTSPLAWVAVDESTGTRARGERQSAFDQELDDEPALAGRLVGHLTYVLVDLVTIERVGSPSLRAVCFRLAAARI